MTPDKLLLINPNRMKPPVAPLGLDYLSCALTREGIEHQLLDLTWEEEGEGAVSRTLAGGAYGAVGITIRNTCDSYMASGDFQLPRIKELVAVLRQHTDAPIILGGVGYSINPEEILDYCRADFGIKGEGEVSFPLLLKTLPDTGKLAEIPGLYWKERGEYRSNPVAFLPLETMKLSRRGLLDNRRYFQEGGQAGFETTRGCQYRCTYCADPVSKGRKLRLRWPQDVAQELANLYRQDIDHFHTCDSEFNLDPKHLMAVCQALAEEGLGDKIRWYAYCLPYPFYPRIAEAMKRAGCAGINFGADSGDDQMLTRLGRTHKVSDLKPAVELCRQYGFAVMFDLLLGGPGEDRQTMARTIALMKELNPDRVGLSYGLRVYRYTALARLIKREGFGPDNPSLHGAIEDNFEFMAPLYYLSPELKDDGYDYLQKLVGQDPRFFLGDKTVAENYNYNDNSRLTQALRQGHRGAYWDILRKVQEESGRSQ